MSRQQHPQADQVLGRACEQRTLTLRTDPRPRLQPADDFAFHAGGIERPVPVGGADLGLMVKPRAALPILDQAHRQRHRELARRPTQDTRRHLDRVLQKPAEISHRPQLQRETETVDLAAPHGDPRAVIIGEEEATGQLIV